MAVIRNGHSVSDNLYEIFVYVTCTAFWWKGIAEKNFLVNQYYKKSSKRRVFYNENI